MLKFPTIEELRGMSVNQLKLIDIQTKEQEDLIQKVYDEKVIKEPTAIIFNVDVPDIKTPEEEAIWQSKVNEAVEKSKPTSYSEVADSKIEEAVKELETIQKEVEATIAPVSPETPSEVISTPTKQPFCNSCDSKGRFHKAGCPNRK